MKRFAQFLATALAFASTAAHASNNTDWAYLTSPFGTSNGAVLFSTAVSTTGRPSCGAGLPNRWAVDASTVAGRSQLSLLMMAYALHKRVFVVGTHGCSIWGDTETVWYFHVEN